MAIFGLHGGSGTTVGKVEESEARFADRMKTAVRETIRPIGAKTFYVKSDGLWVDSAYDAKDKARVKEIKLWSDEFFDLIRKHPEVSKVAAETQKFIICIGSEIYQVE